MGDLVGLEFSGARRVLLCEDGAEVQIGVDVRVDFEGEEDTECRQRRGAGRERLEHVRDLRIELEPGELPHHAHRHARPARPDRGRM